MTETNSRNDLLIAELSELLSEQAPPVHELHVVFATEGLYTGTVSWRDDTRPERIEIAEF